MTSLLPANGMNPFIVFDCCDCCDALLTEKEGRSLRFGQHLCDHCCEETQKANPGMKP